MTTSFWQTGYSTTTRTQSVRAADTVALHRRRRFLPGVEDGGLRVLGQGCPTLVSTDDPHDAHTMADHDIATLEEIDTSICWDLIRPEESAASAYATAAHQTSSPSTTSSTVRRSCSGPKLVRSWPVRR